MLDSIYHMTIKLLNNIIFGMQTSRICHLLCKVIMDALCNVTKSVNYLTSKIIMHGVISLPDATNDNNTYFCVACEAWLTRRDHVIICIMALKVSDR